jgi:hypothetical protein
VVDEAERAKNRTKSKVRARVEHSIGIIKRVFGFAKVRYRGLTKSTHRLLVTCALANLFMARRQSPADLAVFASLITSENAVLGSRPHRGGIPSGFVVINSPNELDVVAAYTGDRPNQLGIVRAGRISALSGPNPAPTS